MSNKPTLRFYRLEFSLVVWIFFIIIIIIIMYFSAVAVATGQNLTEVSLLVQLAGDNIARVAPRNFPWRDTRWRRTLGQLATKSL